MKICFFGSYDKNVASIIKLVLNNQEVIIDECQQDVYSKKELIKAYFRLLRKHRGKYYDIMIVPWRGIMTMPLAKLIKKGPIVFFPYIPLYDSIINDRKIFGKNSIQAKFVRFAEKMACKMSDMIILDNFETINYFCSEYHLSKKKFRRLLTGINEEQFYPLPIKTSSKIFNVFFWGSFIPYHGVDVIVEAARILKNNDDIQFVLCGDGATKKKNEDLARDYDLKNIHFLGFVPISELRKNLENADICIGIVANAERRTNATPNKIFEILAAKKSLITRDVSVMREINLENRENCILVKPGDPEKLAETIMELKNNPELIKRIAINGYETYQKIAYKQKVGKELIGYLNELVVR